ncbi:MAG: SHOCT-like domain-containing protein [Chitinophagales bacterium]
MMEERKQILEMLASGKITVDEAARLLEAVEGPAAAPPAAGLPAGLPGQPTGKARYLRVRVTENGRQKVNVNIPLGLAKAGLGFAKAGMKIANRSNKHPEDLAELESLDFDEIIRQIEAGTSGKIVDVTEGDKLVEVYVE